MREIVLTCECACACIMSYMCWRLLVPRSESIQGLPYIYICVIYKCMHTSTHSRFTCGCSGCLFIRVAIVCFAHHFSFVFALLERRVSFCLI